LVSGPGVFSPADYPDSSPLSDSVEFLGKAVDISTTSLLPQRWGLWMYEIELTATYRVQLNRLTQKFHRFVLEAIDILKESPTQYQDRIMVLSKQKEKNQRFRYRLPGGIYLFYTVHQTQPLVTLTGIRKQS
jgi:mRNA-degrading endonuclease RelE of RelBE toxin-antitoxin system